MKDIYVYPDTNVLVNKLNIKSLKELEEVEKYEYSGHKYKD